MDGLALLCTLHADGPSTMKRLRGAGCIDLQALLARSTEELAQLLDVPPAQARRLRREAGLLRERVTGGLLQEEEGVSSAPRAEADAQPASGDLSSVDRAILGRVLDSWRERDARAGDGALEPPVELVPAAGDIGPSTVLARAELTTAALIGLEPGLVADLAALGIVSMRAFVEAEPVELASRLGWPFSEVRRLQFLGGRGLASEVEPAPPAAASLAEHEPACPARKVSTAAGDRPFGAGIAGGGGPGWDFEIPRRVTLPSEAGGGEYDFGAIRQDTQVSQADADAAGGPFV